MNSFTESIVEEAALARLGMMGCVVPPGISYGKPRVRAAERILEIA